MERRTLDSAARRRRVVSVLVWCSAPACANGEPVADGVAVTDVTVVDVTAGVARPGMTVVIRDQEIAVVRPSAQVRLGPAVERVPGSGLFLIPGLWEMHTHMQGTGWHAERVDLPIYIANGITGVRLMTGGCDPALLPSPASCMSDTTAGVVTPELLNKWRREIATGAQVGPEIIAASMLIDGARHCWGGGYVVEDSVQARETVEHALRMGVDFLKIYNCSLGTEGYHAVTEAASRAGIDFVGHVPGGVSWADASAAGQRSIEHVGPQLLRACSARPEKVARAAQAQRESGYSVESQVAYWDALVGTFEVAACEELIETFLANGTAFVPTFAVTAHNGELPQELNVDADPRLRYLAPSTLASWSSALERANGYEPEPRLAALWRRAGDHMNAAVAEMARRGVPILAGSDPANLMVFPGFSLHEELEHLVKAGLTPAQALRAATLEPALFLGWAQEVGTVEEGKRANLVLLREDPLTDIRNTQTIEAVLVAGRLLDRTMLDSLLARAARAALTPVAPG